MAATVGPKEGIDQVGLTRFDQSTLVIHAAVQVSTKIVGSEFLAFAPKVILVTAERLTNGVAPIVHHAPCGAPSTAATSVPPILVLSGHTGVNHDGAIDVATVA